MTRRLLAFVALAVVLGALFVRLGVWQLDRRSERRALNEQMKGQLRRAPVSITELGGNADAANRRATVSGTPDLANEFVVTGRSRNGSPGVHIFTPIRLGGRDTAVLVNRGWVYAPDAATIDLNRWREARTTFTGFTQLLPDPEPVGVPPAGRSMRQLSHRRVARLMPYPVHTLYLVSQDSGAGDRVPARLDAPLLSDGPHLSYAIQWFAFAAIALIGAAAVVLRARRAARDGAQLAREGGIE